MTDKFGNSDEKGERIEYFGLEKKKKHTKASSMGSIKFCSFDLSDQADKEQESND